MGAVTHGRAGLGSGTTSRYNKAQGKDRRSLVKQEVRTAVEEERASRMVGMRQQGAWTRWEHAADRRVMGRAVESGLPSHMVPDPGCL